MRKAAAKGTKSGNPIGRPSGRCRDGKSNPAASTCGTGIIKTAATIGVGFGPALTPRAQPQTAGFYFARPRPRPVVDPVFEAGALELQPAPAAAGIVRPNAACTFFEGP